MKARKENKVYQISTDAEKQRYLKAGYDIYDDEGKIIEHSPLKKVAYAELEKVQVENAALKEELETLKTENAALKEGNVDDADVISILTEYAKEHEIDLGRATTTSGIAKKIKEATPAS